MGFTVLTGEFAHETNVFSVREADYAAFLGRYVLAGQAAIEARGDANTGLAGFLDVARAKGWSVVHTVSAATEPSGLVTQDAFERIVGMMVDAAKAHRGRIDGVALALHGAMVTEDFEDGEGETLARLRAVLGMDIPIAITLDLHANVTSQMVALAPIIVSYKTYPHVDMRLVARQAAEILHRTMAGEIKPRTLRIALPMVEEPNGCRTDVGPMVDWVARGRAYEAEPDVFAVSINGGFGAADITEAGPSVLVTAQGDMRAHRLFAQGIAAEMWASRGKVINRYFSVEDAVAIARDHRPDPGGQPGEAKHGPIIIADYADNPGGGAYGDGTNLLRAMLGAGLEGACFGPLVDPQAAAQLHRYAMGETVRIAIGGKTDPAIGGGPIEVTARLEHLADGTYTGDGPMIGGLTLSFGPTAVLDIDGIKVLVVSIPTQMRDLQQFQAFGIDPCAMRVVALKSMQHFRAAFEPIASRVIVCDSGALCTPDVTKLPFRRIRRPIWPLDPDAAFEADQAD